MATEISRIASQTQVRHQGKVQVVNWRQADTDKGHCNVHIDKFKASIRALFKCSSDDTSNEATETLQWL